MITVSTVALQASSTSSILVESTNQQGSFLGMVREGYPTMDDSKVAAGSEIEGVLGC